jgi:hypothetical protein
MIATTADKKIVEMFNRLRKSNGKEFISQDFKNKISIETDLKIHRQNPNSPISFLKRCLLTKNGTSTFMTIYFTRSWTGALIYKAYARTDKDSVTIYKVESEGNKATDNSFAISNVHFLVSTQILKGILPHRVPTNHTTDIEIAQYSFSLFGNKCWYATHDDILDTVIKNKVREN